MSTRPHYRLVGIHGAPRSGTTWLGALFDSHEAVTARYQPFFSYAFRGRVEADSPPNDIRAAFDDMFVSNDAFLTQTGAARLARSATVFRKVVPTHLVYKEVRFHDLIEPILRNVPTARLIGLVRDPIEVLESWIRAPREFRPDWRIEEEWRSAARKNAGLPENWYGFNRWKELATLFLRLELGYPEQFRLMRYADLAMAPEHAVADLFGFTGLAMTQQTRDFIQESTSRDDGDPYGVHRIRGVRTPGELPDYVRDAVRRELAGTPLSPFLIGTQ